MKKSSLLIALLSIILFSCKKDASFFVPQKQSTVNTQSDDFIKYVIYKGQQTCAQSAYVSTEYSELKFIVKFDSTAIYKSVIPVNQLDINKLYGFSDNNAVHQQFSARFGWRWSDSALYLFGYTYNNGIRAYKKLGSVKIGTENFCSIKVDSTSYIFTLNDAVDSMERKSSTPDAVGYQLYPYFGGDELAPHDINIWIKQIR